MEKKNLNLVLVISLLLILPLVSSVDLTSSSTAITYKGYTITPSLDGKIYNLVSDSNSFYIENKDKKPLALSSYYIKTDFNPDEIIDPVCITYNQFKSECKGSKFDDTKFLQKNNVTRQVMIIDEKGVWWTIENFFKSILGIKPTPAYTYVINYTGTITDTDPALVEVISTTTSGTFNKTEAGNNGIRNVASVLYYPLDKNDSMDTINYLIGDLNTYYPDGSIYNNFGRSYNPWTNPRNLSVINGSLRFDGVNDYVKSNQTYVQAANSSRTVSYWIYTATQATGYPQIFSYGNFFSIYRTNAIGLYSVGQAAYFNSKANLAPNSWVNVIITYNGTDKNITTYINGSASNSTILAGSGWSTTTDNFWIGTQSTAGAGYYTGGIDEVMYFNRTLTDLEASYIYNNQSAGLRSSGLETDADLVMYLDFDNQRGLNTTSRNGKYDGNLINFDKIQQPTFQLTGGHDGLGTYNFDGVSQGIDLGNNIYTNAQMAKGMSWCAWLNFSNINANNYDYVYDLEGVNSVANYARKMTFATATSGGTATATTNTITGNMTYFCGVCNPNDVSGGATGSLRIYANGVEMAGADTTSVTHCGSFDANTRTSRIGSAYNGVYNMNGTINDFVIYSYPLEPDDIANLYANQTNVSGKYLKLGSQTYDSAVFYNNVSAQFNINFSIADTTSTRSNLVNADNSINTSNENLVAYYSLDDMTGLTTPNGALNASGLSSKALKFSINQYVDVPNKDTSGVNVTLSFWTNPQSLPTVSATLIGRSNSLRKSLYFSGTGQMVYRDAGTNVSVINYPTLLNKWNYITFIINDTGTTGYLNGVYVGSNVFGGTGINGGIDFETILNPTIPSLNMTINEVIMYNKSLSFNEIQELYKSGLSQKAKTNVTIQTRTANTYNISDTGLVSFWSFNNDNASLVIDETGRNNGTYTEAVSNSTSGMVGNGVFFDDTNDVITTSNAVMINGSSGITISAWVMQGNGADAYDGIVFSRGSSTAIFGLDVGATAGSFSCMALDTQGSNSITYPLNTWHHVVETWDVYSNKTRLYVDGALSGETAKTGTSFNQNTQILIGYDSSSSRYFRGNIDEVRIYNRSLSAEEILSLYQLGSSHITDWSAWSTESLLNDNSITQTGFAKFAQYRTNLYTNSSEVSPYVISYNITTNTAPNVTFNNQVPFPLNFSNVFGKQGVNFTYNISDDGTLDALDLYYKTNDTDNIMYYQNGTAYSGYFAKNSPTNISNKYTWNLLDNEYLSGTYNVGPISEDNLVHKSFSLTSNNEFVSIQYFNISSVRQLGFFELMANRSSGTGGLRAYYCNNNWDTSSNPATNANCLNFYTLKNNTYDHCHLNQSCHMVLPFTNFSIITQIGYFIVRGNTGSTWDVWYSDGSVRSNYIKKASNPSTWVFNNSINIDGHLHQFGSATTLHTYACASDTLGLQTCSPATSQAIGGGTIAPSGLGVLNPQNLTYEKGLMNINYTQCYSPSNYQISYYNITLINTDNTYNLSIIENNSLNLNYSWDNLAVANGNYKVEVKCYDVLGTSSTARSEVFSLIPEATPPVLTITSPANITYYNTIVPLTTTCTDNILVNKTYYSIDGGGNSVYTSPTNLYTIGYEVYHDITIYCEDTGGNTVNENRRFYVGNYPTTNGTAPAATSGVNTCAYKKMGYYNTKLPWYRPSNCV